jgi:hypothetical protein
MPDLNLSGVFNLAKGGWYVSPTGDALTSLIGNTIPIDSYLWLRLTLVGTMPPGQTNMHLIYVLQFNGAGAWTEWDVGPAPPGQPIRLTRNISAACRKGEAITSAAFATSVSCTVGSSLTEVVGWRPRPFDDAFLKRAGLPAPTRADYEKTGFLGSPSDMGRI